MLNIRVLGKGLIPRGLGIAPHKDAFPADLTTISTIMQTRGLIVEAFNPDTGKFTRLTSANVKRIWDKYGKIPYKKPQILNMNEKPDVLNNDGKKDNKEPAVYQPKNNNSQQQNGYKEVSKEMIHDTVQEVADKIIGAPNQNNEEKKEETENKNEQSTTDKTADQKNDQKNNNSQQQNNKNGFKPVNNSKK